MKKHKVLDKEMRAWNKKKNKWFYFTLRQIINNKLFIDIDSLSDWCEYMGFKDVNGKKIYEEDIVSAWEAICVIKKNLTLAYKDDEEININSQNIRVLGNTKENPNLIKE